MDSSLLTTQVHIPPETGQIMHRPRLTEMLEVGLPRCKLLLVSAPAGYGKTTLLSQWAHTSQLPVAWFSLTGEENDIERFFRYWFSAWEQVQPEVQGSALHMMLEGSMPDIHSVLAAFINLANENQGHIAFVFDDYHLIDDSHIHEALTYLLDHLPSSVHLVISTRVDPPLPLARYRAHAELMELRPEDLHFMLEETEDFFNHLLELNLSRTELEKLQTQLEGWAAGLRLVGLTLRPGHSEVFEQVLTGKHRYVADYLSQDVLAGLSDSLREFLLETSILDRLSGPLCDAVTGKGDGQTTLETLERENLFLIPLDHSRDWYRYHRLFADFLREELSRRYPDRMPRLHGQAARWHLDHDLPEQAYRHSLAAGDLELMTVVFDRYTNAKLLGGELGVLRRWLAGLSGEWFSANPVLGLARAGYLAYTGEFEECLRVVDDVEKRLSSEESRDTRGQLAKVKAVRCFLACTTNDLVQAESYAAQALRNLPEGDLGFRPVIYAALGDTYRQNGRWDEARQCYLKALAFTQSPSIRVQSAHVYGALADLELRQGKLQNAASYWRNALASIQERENWGRLPLPIIGWFYIRMAELLYEWNELDSAASYLSQGLERAELGGDVRTFIAGFILSARINLSLGDVEKASDFLEQARSLVEQAHFSEWTARYERCQLELWLAENRLRAAVDWADKIQESDVLVERLDSEITQLAIARVLIVKGDLVSIERALALLKRLLKVAQGDGRLGVAIETLALQALAEWRRGEWVGALTALEGALRIAEPDGYLRLFADLGLPMGRLLQEAHSRSIKKDFVEKLLEVYGSSLSSSASTGQILPEPLTPREQEILKLVAAGLTNREIAEQLVISPETVKKHVGSISGKVGASNRTEAVALARELGLLS